jgi:hypothetical protein
LKPTQSHVRRYRSIMFQMAEVMMQRALFLRIVAEIVALRPLPPPARC